MASRDPNSFYKDLKLLADEPAAVWMKRLKSVYGPNPSKPKLRIVK